MNAFMNPSMSALAKLGSVVVHVDEMLSPEDPEIVMWLSAGRKLAMIPEKRR